MRPHPDVWIGVGTAIVLFAPLALSRRPTRRSRALLLSLTVSMLFIAAFTTSGFLRFGDKSQPERAYWVWIGSAALLCASPWLRRRDQLETLAAWNARPNAPDDDLPALPHLPANFAGLVEQTRAVRASLDVFSGLDGDTRQLLWEWCQRVETCSPEDEAVLADLGLGSEPVKAFTARDAAIGPDGLFVLDAALARFERTLLDYRSYGFR